VLIQCDKEEAMNDPFADQVFRLVHTFTRAQAAIARAAALAVAPRPPDLKAPEAGRDSWARYEPGAPERGTPARLTVDPTRAPVPPVAPRVLDGARTSAPHPVGPVGPVAVLAELLRALPGVWQIRDTHGTVDGATAEVRDPAGRRYRVSVTVLPEEDAR
jgi:hypothetical protein